MKETYSKNTQPMVKISVRTCLGNSIPAGTKSFDIICDDPDAKPVCGFEFIHVCFNLFFILIKWLVKDITADVKEFPEHKCLGTNI